MQQGPFSGLIDADHLVSMPGDLESDKFVKDDVGFRTSVVLLEDKLSCTCMVLL